MVDDGTRASAAQMLNPTQTAGANLLTLLLQGSGLLETALLRGKRYQVTDLQTIINPPGVTPPATTTGAQYLIGLVADITLWLIYTRRPMPGLAMPMPAQIAMRVLDDIASGERILALDENAEAGTNIGVVAPDEDQPIGVFLPDPLTKRTSDFFGDRNAG